MLLERVVPPGAKAWNSRWHAPFGRQLVVPMLDEKQRRRLAWRFPRLVGPFGFQPNNDTRVVEYPWAHGAVPLRRGMQVVDLGGGLAGFQFVLARSGLHVINIDPGEWSASWWRVQQTAIDRLNRAFGTDVELRTCTLQEAALPAASVDVVYSISTIEHIPGHELPALMREVARILKPGGSAVLTIDLFLDVAPFTSRVENEHGWNADVAALVAASGLEMTTGNRAELLGFDEFDPDAVLSRLAEVYVGTRYPACVQALVLSKPLEPAA